MTDLGGGLLALGRGGRLQQAGEGVGRVFADDQPFLFGAALLGLRLLGPRYLTDGKVKSAPAGDRTRTTLRSPACKAGVFASYTTGASQKSVGAAAGRASNPSPLLSWSGP